MVRQNKDNKSHPEQNAQLYVLIAVRNGTESCSPECRCWRAIQPRWCVCRNLVQPLLSSSLSGWGIGSLDNDADELSLLARHLGEDLGSEVRQCPAWFRAGILHAMLPAPLPAASCILRSCCLS